MGEHATSQDGREVIPYAIIAQALQAGNVVPFLGAGASAAHRPLGESWAPEKEFGPFASELANHLAHESQFPDEKGRDDLMLVASYFESHQADRPRLHRKLDEIFCNDKLRPGPIHRLLASCPNLPLIVTTNYDSLIEQAFDSKVHVVVDHGEPLLVNVRFMGEKFFSSRLKAELGPLVKMQEKAQGRIPIVFKMHGAAYKASEILEIPGSEAEGWAGAQTQASPGRFVLTADDYVRVLEKQMQTLPAYVQFIMDRSGFLFLGYGLADWNVRVLLSTVRQKQRQASEQKSWAIQHNPLRSEQKIWEKRGVNLYHGDLGEFAQAVSRELGLPERSG